MCSFILVNSLNKPGTNVMVVTLDNEKNQKGKNVFAVIYIFKVTFSGNIPAGLVNLK